MLIIKGMHFWTYLVLWGVGSSIAFILHSSAVYHCCYLAIRLVARKGYESLAHEAKPNGLLIRGP